VLLDVELVFPSFGNLLCRGKCAREMLPGFERIWNDCIQEETRLVSMDHMDGMVKNSSGENQSLVARTRKGRRGSPRRGDSPERESSPEMRWKRYVSKI
jgi:hypothetical protein